LAWHEKKEYDRAIKDFDEAIRLNPRFEWAFNNRGWTRHQKKDYKKAIKDYGEAIRITPGSNRPSITAAWLYANFARPCARE
jgi:tetratricopeptide (TPR) repeat protein